MWLRFSPVAMVLVISFVTACSGTAEPTPRAASDAAPAGAAIPPNAGAPAAAATTATAGTALERSGDQVRGLVDVGGYRLYLDCMGSGVPVVVLEGGFSSGASAWYRIQPEVATTTRVCAYDRANRGKSDRGPEVNTAEQMVAALRTALATAGILGPYVLAAHSFGGYVALLYAGRYPAEVAGLVLVESSHYDSYEFMVDSPVMNRVDFIASRAQVRAARPLPDVPLVVLSRGQPSPQAVSEEQWQVWQRDLAHQVPRGKQVIVADATHEIPSQQPQAVIDAIREVVDTARGAR